MKQKRFFVIAMVCVMILAMMPTIVFAKSDVTWEWVVKPKYSIPWQEARAGFNEGLAAVWESGSGGTKWGYIDYNGKVVIPFKYDDAMQFSDGLAAVKITDKNSAKWGFIDKKGKVVIPFEYDEVKPFSDGLAAVRIGIDYVGTGAGPWGYIDKKGKLVIPMEHYYATSFSYGRAAVSDSERHAPDGIKYGYIDTSGNLVIPMKYYTNNGGYPHDLSHNDGLATVRTPNSSPPDGGWGFMDVDGKVLIEVGDMWRNMDPYTPHFRNGMALVFLNEKEGWQFIDTKGNVLDVNLLSYAGVPYNFNEGLAVVYNIEWEEFAYLYGVVDKEGNIVMPLEYSHISRINGSHAFVQLEYGGLWGIVRFNGNTEAETETKTETQNSKQRPRIQNRKP
jgi:hypothetical protein